MAHLNSSKVLQPGKQAFDFPTSFVPSQDSPILGGRFLAVGLMRSDHLNSLFLQTRIERVTIICPVTNQSFWLFFDKPFVQGVFH